MATIRMVVDRVEAGYRDYPRVRSELLAEGAPEDLLPEQFDPEFFIALDIASQVPIGAPAPVPMMDQMGVQGFAQGGLASLPVMNPVAQQIASMGRNGDTMLAHITPQEAMMLRREGGSGTINPYTGLPEFFLKKAFKKIGNAVKKFAKSTVGRIVIGVAAGMILGPAVVGFLQGAGATLSLAATTAITAGTGAFVSGLAAGDGFKNSLKAAVVSGVTAYGGSALFSGGASMATPAAGTGPQSFGEGLSQGWNQTKDAVTSALGLKDATVQPSAAEMDRLQQEAAIRQAGGSTGTDYLGTGDAQSLLEAQAREQRDYLFPRNVDVEKTIAGPIQEPLRAATSPIYPSGQGPYALDSTEVPQIAMPSTTAMSPADYSLTGARTVEGLSAMPTGQAPKVPATSSTAAGQDKNIFGQIYDYFSPSAREAAGATGILGKYGPLAVAGLGATAAMGGFKAPPTDDAPLGFDPITGLRPGEIPYQEQRPDLFGPDRRLSAPSFNLSETLVQSPRFSTPVPSGVPVYMPPNMMTFQPGGVQQPYNRSGLYGIPAIYTAKKGSGPEGVTNFPRKTGPINGPGTGTSDSIPAMLSDGEFVFTAKAVRNMGNGSRRKGAARMYKLMKMLEGGPVKKG